MVSCYFKIVGKYSTDMYTNMFKSTLRINGVQPSSPPAPRLNPLRPTCTLRPPPAPRRALCQASINKKMPKRLCAFPAAPYIFFYNDETTRAEISALREGLAPTWFVWRDISLRNYSRITAAHELPAEWHNQVRARGCTRPPACPLRCCARCWVAAGLPPQELARGQ